MAVGYVRVKLKVRPGFDLEPVRAVRAAWPDLALGVDANGSYRRDDLGGALRALDGCGLVEIEQPLPAGDLVGLAEACRRLDDPGVPRRVRRLGRPTSRRPWPSGPSTTST